MLQKGRISAFMDYGLWIMVMDHGLWLLIFINTRHRSIDY